MHACPGPLSRPHRLLLWWLGLAASTVAGADPADAISPGGLTLPPVLVTATRTARITVDAPVSGAVLDSTQLHHEQAVRTLPDALKFEPGVLLQRTGHGQGSPYIRGFTGYRNLLLVDGIRLNNAVFREGPNQYWNTVDALSLSRLELVRGPVSTLYGSDAVGGTVQAFTRGDADLRPDSDWDRRLYARYATAEQSITTRLESIGRLTDRLTLTLGYTYKDFGDLHGGRGVGHQPRTGYDERHWDAKLEYFPDSEQRLTLAHQQGRIDDAWRTHSTPYGLDWRGLSLGKDLRRVLDQQRDLSYLQYHREREDALVSSIHAGLYRQNQYESEHRLRTEGRNQRQGFDVETFGAFVTLASPSPLGRLSYGLDLSRDRTSSFRHTLNPDGSFRSAAIQGAVADDATYDRAGAFVQSETQLAERLELLIAGRYDYARADAPRVADPRSPDPMAVSDDWSAVVGSLRLLGALDPAGRLRLFAGLSQGFRSPNLSNLTSFDIARTNEIETPVQHLDPERYLAFETGLKGVSERWSTHLAYAYTHIDGMIVRTPTGRVIEGANEVTKRNAGGGYVQTVECEARYWILADLSLFGTFTWTEGRVDGYPDADSKPRREHISRLMPPTGRLGMRWDHDRNAWFEAVVTAAGRARRLSPSDEADTSRIPPGGTPGYNTLDLRAGYRPKPDLRLSVALENVTNESYRLHGSGVQEPGRNLVLAADWTF